MAGLSPLSPAEPYLNSVLVQLVNSETLSQERTTAIAKAIYTHTHTFTHMERI